MIQARTVAAYAAGVVTTLLAIATGQALASGAGTVRFDRLEVNRIDVREPDGTLRMVISNRAEFPGIIVKGREYPHASRNDAAGMIFFNDEGTENGGLIFGGHKTAGKVTNFGHLSFDQYDQDQVMKLEQGEENGGRYAGLTIDDRPVAPLDFAGFSRLESLPPGPARDALLKTLTAENATAQPRVFVGKDRARDSQVALRDAQGHIRLVMNVTAAGEASIRFLDAAGKVTRSLRPS